jgi:hypothetical protein
MGFSVCGEKAARIADNGLTLSAREDTSGNLSLLDSKVACRPNCPRAIFGGEGCGVFYKAIHLTILLLSRHGKKARILWLALRKREGCFNRCAKGVLVNAIGRGARRAAVHNSANGNYKAMLGDVLMNPVVGKTRQTVRNFIDMDFSFLGSRRASQTKDTIDHPVKLALGEKFRGRGSVAGS